MGIKRCFKCGTEKPLDAFYRHPQMADGRLGKCKECAKSDVRQHRRTSENPRVYDRERAKLPEVAARIARVSRDWRKAHPDRYRAQVAANNALRDGRIRRRTTCSRCRKKARLHKHHDDYSQPLKVRWLCAKCHVRLDKSV